MNELTAGDIIDLGDRFDDYQNQARKTIVYPYPGNNLNYPLFGLAGEVGELLQHLKKNMRDGDGKITPELVEKLEGEIGDILWYLACICFELSTSLGKCAVGNLNKLHSRAERGTLHGSGDTR